MNECYANNKLKGRFLMQTLIEQRLKELRTEFESGQKILADLENQQANIRDTLLRISGAIQVLEEMIADESSIEEVPEQTGQDPEILTSQ
jgi:hypothetical protein